MMTDSIESKKLAVRDLHMQVGSTLLYQDDGIVAAGSQGGDRQIANMQKIGLSAEEILLITSKVPRNILTKREQYLAEKLNDQVNCI